MSTYPEADLVREMVDQAHKIVIVQADNPDTDSLASSLILEQILDQLKKEPIMYSGVDMPSYMHYLAGWDRVTRQLPNQFDLSIIVDTGSLNLLEQLSLSGQLAWLKSKPSIIIDHHITKPTIDFAKLELIKPAVATAEIIYELAKQLNWPLNERALQMVAIAILSDSLGLTSEGTSARSIHIIGELVEQGVDLPEIESARREMLRRESELVHYKGQLLQRVEYHHNDQIATVSIPWEEIERYSSLFNPSMLVIDDMRLAKNTDIAVCFKSYPDGKITAKIRANYKRGVADKLAEHFGGGGHPYASGFKVQDGRKLSEVKQEAIEVAIKLLKNLDGKASDAVI